MIAPGLGIDAGQAAHGAEHGRRHLRLQILPDHGGVGGVACMATERPVFLEYDYQQFVTYTGKRSPFCTTEVRLRTRTANCWPWKPTGSSITVPIRNSAIC